MRRFNEILKIQWRIRGIAILRDFPETSFHIFSAPWRGCKRPWNKRATANSRLRRFALYAIFSLPNFNWFTRTRSFFCRTCATDLVLRDTLLTRLFYMTRIVNCHVRLWTRVHSTDTFVRHNIQEIASLWNISFFFAISFHEIHKWPL